MTRCSNGALFGGDYCFPPVARSVDAQAGTGDALDGTGDAPAAAQAHEDARASPTPPPPPPPAAVTETPVPQYELRRLAADSDELAHHLVLRVEMPLVAAMSGVSLSVSEHEVEVEAEGVYSPLRLTLPERVDDQAGSAKFDKKARALTIKLPVASSKHRGGELV